MPSMCQHAIPTADARASSSKHNSSLTPSTNPPSPAPSTHLPLWVELKVDFSDQYLECFLKETA